MFRLLAQNWWLIVLRGVFAIVFGLAAWTWPGVTLVVLVFLWGAYAFADGILALVTALSGAGGSRWWALIAWAIASLLAAAMAFFYPKMTAVALLYVIGAWAVVTGALEIAAAIRLRKEIKGEFWLALAGAGSMLFGMLVLARPGTGALAVIWLIGVYAVSFGILLVMLGVRVKGLRDLPHRARPATSV